MDISSCSKSNNLKEMRCCWKPNPPKPGSTGLKKEAKWIKTTLKSVYGGLNLLISILGILTFCGFTAYDIQKIKVFHAECYNAVPEDVSRFVIISALELYLDFINLFLYVLRLLNDD